MPSHNFCHPGGRTIFLLPREEGHGGGQVTAQLGREAVDNEVDKVMTQSEKRTDAADKSMLFFFLLLP